MALTGNTYGSKVARVGVTALVAHFDQSGSGDVLTYEARVTAIMGDGSPLLSVASPAPMVSSAFEFVACSSVAQIEALTPGQWTWPLTPRNIVGIKPIVGSADVSAAFGDGWVTVAEGTYSSVGGTTLALQWLVVASVTLAGQARITVDDAQVGQYAALAALDGASVSLFSPVALAISDPATVYTIAVQVRAPVLGSAVTVASEGSPLTNGVRVTPVEYH